MWPFPSRDLEMELNDSMDAVAMKALALRSSHDRLVAALNICLPLMKEDWGQLGPKAPETRALRAAIGAVTAAENV